MILEEIITGLMEQTSKTPSGGSCRIGEASITVRYCSDIWEWEYRGETFWDVLDLVEALVRDNKVAIEKVPSALIKETDSKVRPISKAGRWPGHVDIPGPDDRKKRQSSAPFLEPPKPASVRGPDAQVSLRSPLPLRDSLCPATEPPDHPNVDSTRVLE